MITFKYELSVTQVVHSILSNLDCIGINATVVNKYILFTYNKLDYTIVVHSANRFTLVYYCSKTDHSASEDYTYIEDLFDSLNDISKTQVQVTTEIVLHEEEMELVTKEWVIPVVETKKKTKKEVVYV